MATLNGVDLGVIKREEENKDSGLFKQPMPFSDSSQSLMMDIFGASRTKTVDGEFIGEIEEQRDFVNAIKGLQNGQQPGYVFVSDWSGESITVLIESFRHSKVEAEVNRVTYSLTLSEGFPL
jgi:hypothetical protein